jgi:hypothetical protein
LADAAKENKAKATEKEAKAAEKASTKAASAKTAKEKQLANAKAPSRGANNKRKQAKDDALPSSANPSKPKTSKVAQGSPVLPSDSTTIFQPLVSALTAVVSNLAARSSPANLVPNAPAEVKTVLAMPTKAEQREDSKHDHILRREMRMDELKYIREMKSIFSEPHPLIVATTSTSAAATAISAGTPGSISAFIPQTPSGTNQDVDLNEAWRILSNVDSWQNADEKVSVLNNQIGASSQSDLSFLDPADLKLLVGKLKLVQANRLKRALKLI